MYVVVGNDFNGLSRDPLASTRPAQVGINEGFPPKKVAILPLFAHLA